MSGIRSCPTCGSGNALQSTKCWVCGGGLEGQPSPSVARLPGPAPGTYGSTQGFKALGWVSLLLGIGFTAILIGVELAMEWPGLLVPYALVVLVTFVALGRTAWVHLKKKPETPQAPPTASAAAAGGGAKPAASKPGVTGSDVAHGVALGLTVALAVIAALALMAITAIVLFAVICLAYFGLIMANH